MTQLSQKKFSKKIFLTIFGTGVVKTLAYFEKDKEQPELNELFNEMINHDVDNLSVKLVTTTVENGRGRGT